jgi:hypothetical protein
MRLRRPLLLTAVAATLATMTPAMAATKAKPITDCNLVQDKTGDGHSSTYSFVSSPALDLVSADIATGKGELVAVLRLGGTTTTDSNWGTIGSYGWDLKAQAGGVSYEFQMTRRTPLNGGGDHWSATVGGADVAMKATKITANSLEWHISRSLLTALNKKAGQVFTAFDAHTSWNSSTADTPDKALPKYPDKAKSCVKAV